MVKPWRCLKWVENACREDLLKRPMSYVHLNCLLCSLHFEIHQFTNKSAKNRLNWNAVPTLFDNVPNPPKHPAPQHRPLKEKYEVSEVKPQVVKVPYSVRAEHSYSKAPKQTQLVDSSVESSGTADHTDVHTDVHADGHTDGHSDGHTNGHTDGQADVHTDGHTDGHADGHTDGPADILTDVHPDGHTNSHTDNHADGHTEGHADGHTEGHADGHTEGHADGHTEGHADGHTEGHTDGRSDVHTHIHRHVQTDVHTPTKRERKLSKLLKKERRRTFRLKKKVRLLKKSMKKLTEASLSINPPATNSRKKSKLTSTFPAVLLTKASHQQSYRLSSKHCD
ncbi:circumsporozoite protein-like isoform X2 [Patiria miniata]|uniref:THAP-type domain-containing protein n=1 Tax=Patiria miniata TaxID=46514 RepID=A0A913ZJP3_PATMI|nr:circumsporozoite protein-like isoform X2 [Patiria miniata]